MNYLLAILLVTGQADTAEIQSRTTTPLLTVKSGRTGNAIGGALVHYRTPEKWVSIGKTDEQGQLSIAGHGTCKILIEKAGFESHEVELDTSLPQAVTLKRTGEGLTIQGCCRMMPVLVYVPHTWCDRRGCQHTICCPEWRCKCMFVPDCNPCCNPATGIISSRPVQQQQSTPVVNESRQPRRVLRTASR